MISLGCGANKLPQAIVLFHFANTTHSSAATMIFGLPWQMQSHRLVVAGSGSLEKSWKSEATPFPILFVIHSNDRFRKAYSEEALKLNIRMFETMSIMQIVQNLPKLQSKCLVLS